MRPKLLTRRRAVQSVASLCGSALCAQTRAGETNVPTAPLSDLANVLEFLPAARRKLTEDVYATIAGTDRRALEQITFRPRMMVNVTQLDLSLELFGKPLFAPMMVGPMSHLERFHPDGELEMVRGAAAARTPVFISSRSSRKPAEIARAANTPLWFQVYPEADVDSTMAAIRGALHAGCIGVCITVGVAEPKTKMPRLDWPLIERIRGNVKTPLLLKGVMHPEEAQAAVSHGIDGIVVSNHGGMYTSGFADPTEMLPLVADAVGGKVPILVDGSYRRGTDILKALALGARAVLLGRPPVWGLTAYGAAGVRRVLEMLQTELARNMALCGKPDLKSIDRSLIRIHSR